MTTTWIGGTTARYRLQAAALVLTLGGAVMLTGGAVQAQIYYRGYVQPYYEPYYEPAYPGPLRAAEIAGIVAEEGFRLLGRPRLNGQVYLVDVKDRRGRDLRLIVDAYEGIILQSHLAAVPRPPGELRDRRAAVPPVIEDWEAPPRIPAPQITPVPGGEQRATRPAEPARPKAQPRQKPATAAIENKPLPAPAPVPAQPETARPAPPKAAPSEASRVTQPGEEKKPAASAPTPPQAALPEPAKATPEQPKPVPPAQVTPAPQNKPAAGGVPADLPKEEGKAATAGKEGVGSGTKAEPRVVGVPIAPLDDARPPSDRPATPRVPVAPF